MPPRLLFDAVARSPAPADTTTRLTFSEITARFGAVVTDNGAARVRERAGALGLPSYYVNPSGAPEEFDTNIDCFMDLEAGRSQAIVVDEVLARYVMKQRGQEKYKVLDENFGTEQYAVGMRKQDTTLLEKINEAMKACNEDGTTAALNAKWFGE